MIMELLSCMLRRTNYKKTNLPTMKIIQPKDTNTFSPQLPPNKNNKDDLVKYQISWVL